MEVKLMYAIITVVVLVYIALIALFTALPARKRHWSMVLARTGIVIASALISIPLAKLISSKIGHWLYGVIEPEMNAGLQTFLGEVPLVAESVQLIVSLLLAPILFLLLFLVIQAVLNLAIWIVERVIPALRHRSLKNTAIAVPIGAVNGVLVALVTLIPLCGYVAMGNSALSLYQMFDAESNPVSQEEVMAPAPDHIRVEALSMENSTDQEALVDTAKNIGSSAMIKVINTIGLPLFEEMTSGTLDNGNIDFSLSKELPHLIDSAVRLGSAAELIADKDITQEDTEALVSAMQTLLSSDWVAEVAADSISFIAETWKEGEAFMGMEPPEVGTILQPIMDTALTVLSTESVETLRSDVETVLNVMVDLMAVGFLSDEPDYDKLLEELGKDGFISNLMATLNANPHMAPLAEEVKAVSVKVVSSVLGETLKNTDEYDPLIADVAAQLNDVLHLTVEEREPIIRDAIKTAFAEHGVNVPEDVAVEFSEKAITEVGADGVVEPEELKQYLIDNIDEGMGLADGVIDGEEDIIIPDLGI